MRRFGMTGLHGIAAWALLAPILAFLIYFIARPILEHMAARLITSRNRNDSMSPWMILAAGAALLVMLFRLHLAAQHCEGQQLLLRRRDLVLVLRPRRCSLRHPRARLDSPSRLDRHPGFSLEPAPRNLPLRRVAQHYPGEDIRYAVLREKWRAKLYRALPRLLPRSRPLSSGSLMLPVLLIASSEHPGFHVLEISASPCGHPRLARRRHRRRPTQAVQDHQHPGRQGVCQRRSLALFAASELLFPSTPLVGPVPDRAPAPWGWAAILAPLLMLYFLLRVTGIPLTEELALERKGDAYREYQRTTSAFIPWFPKSIADHIDASVDSKGKLSPTAVIRFGIRRRLAETLREKRQAGRRRRSAPH